MAAKRKSDSTRRSFSRPDGDLFTRSPLALEAGRVVCFDQFVAQETIRALQEKCGSDDVFHGAMVCLFYVYDPRSILKHRGEEDRITIALDNNVAPELRAKLKRLISGAEFQAARRLYIDLITSPQERLFLALSKQVSLYADRVYDMDVQGNSKTGKEILDSVAFAQDATKRLKELQAVLNDDAKTRARSDYQSRLFELKESISQ